MTTASMGAGDELGPVIAEFRQGVTTMIDDVRALIDAANNVIDQLPAELAQWLHDRLDEVKTMLGDAVTKINGVLAYTGDVAALRTAGNAWASDVGGPVSGLATMMTLNTMESDDQWHGVAASAYKNTLPVQAAAAVMVKTTTDKINDVLQAMATAIGVFWVGMSTALLTLLVTLAAALPITATVVGAPVGGGMTVGGFIAMGAAIITAIGLLSTVEITAQSQAGALVNTATNDAAFPGGTWPRSTTAFGDARVHANGDLSWKVGQ